ILKWNEMWNEFDTNLHISVIEIGLDHCNNIENIFQEIYIANNNNKKRLTSSLNQKANSELVNARREEKRREEKRREEKRKKQFKVNANKIVNATNHWAT
ncbi:hypothetical protein RDWZM_004443, partial [Blomia tropicalis]